MPNPLARDIRLALGRRVRMEVQGRESSAYYVPLAGGPVVAAQGPNEGYSSMRKVEDAAGVADGYLFSL